MMKLLMIFCVSLALLGCKDQGIAPEPQPTTTERWAPYTTIVSEVVLVKFVDGATLQDAKELIIGLCLSFKFPPPPNVSPVKATVSVPLGTEDQWVEQFKRYPIVKSAGRLYMSIMPQVTGR